MDAIRRLVFASFVVGFLWSAISIADPFLVNQHTAGDQRVAGLAPTADHGFVVVWTSSGQDGSGDGAFARWFGCNANPLTDEVPVNLTTIYDQTAKGVASNGDGSIVVVWTSEAQDGSDLGVFARLFDDAGAPVTDEIPVNVTTVGRQDRPSVAMTPEGDFVVVWHGPDGAGGQEVFARRFAGSGTPLGGEIEVEIVAPGGYVESTSVTTTTGLAFVAAWGVMWSSEWRVSARRFDIDGAAVGQSFFVTVEPQPYYFDLLGQADADDGGAFVISWRRQDTMESDAHYACRYGVSGSLVWCVETSTWSDMTGQGMSVAGSGEMTMVRANFFGADLLARRFAITGDPISDEVVLASHSQNPYGFIQPRVSHLAADPTRWAVVWTDDQTATGVDVHASLSPDWIFGDTFESGTLSNWSR